MTRTVVRLQAERDLEEIAEFYGRLDGPAANRLIETLDRAVESLAQFPMRYRARSDMLLRRYMFVAGFFVVYRYSEEDDVVEVVQVMHSSRDLSAPLAP